MSAAINRGSKIPVEAFSPNTKARITTMRTPNPLTPAFAIPRIKTAKAKANHCGHDKSNEWKKSINSNSVLRSLIKERLHH